MGDPNVVVAGAGSIGCYVGGLLVAGGRRVALLGRERMVADLQANGLQMTSLDGLDRSVAASAFTATTDPAVLATADLVLVTVKSGATAQMAELIAQHAPAEAPIISLQNGLGNAATLREGAGDRRVLAAMVPFNVVQLGNGRFHRGTSGDLLIEAGLPGAIDLLSVPHLRVDTAGDMVPVLWGKLLLNLNNALNALSGLTLHEQLQQRPWRIVLAAQQEEALGLLRAAGIEPWSLGPLPVQMLPRVLRLPTPLFRMLARSAVRIDKRARSSMWEDLERRRPTEIEELQGAVVALAERLGRDAPVNRQALALIRQAEQAGAGSPRLAPEGLGELAALSGHAQATSAAA
jgi:2-dehydropantoate 2-reductase